MMDLSANIRLRPTRIGYLVRPSDRKSVRKVMRVNACLWGGMYNPIIPIFRNTPKEWQEEKFLNKEFILALKEIFPSDSTEFWLFDLMLKSIKPVPANEVAKFTHLTEGAVSQAVPRLNEYLDIFSKRCEVLETKQIRL